ncbi:hypothetical protein [Salinisphaera sp. T31B1]|uniref:hypothetical protein n=1 Tax=Salinisphaera sp. T31B1 TaxID=727963 RepID=UPI00333F0A49
MTSTTRSGLHKGPDQPYATLQFANDEERQADQRRRDALNAYRDSLGVTVQELAELLSRLRGDRVSYWTVRSWTSGQTSRRARITPNWVIKLLDANVD